MRVQQAALPTWGYVALLVAGLLVTPTLAFSDGSNVPRSVTANVVSDLDAFIALEVPDVTLNSSNNYQADAIRITHKHVDGVTVKFWMNNTATELRFKYQSSSGSLSPGASHWVSVEDTNSLHPTGTTTVTAKVEVSIYRNSEQVGRFEVTRDQTITVE